MKKSWYQLYMEEIESKGSIINYVDDKIKHKKELIYLIKKYAPNKKIIEAGCGTGVLSTYMASIGFNSTAIDINEEILNLSKKIAKEYNTKNKPKFKIDSIFELNYKKKEFDVSFSNGVLEHFTDEEIIKSLKRQLDISNIVIVGIPTKYFNQEEAMYGDERYLDFKYWRMLITSAGGEILEEKSNHFLNRVDRILDYKKYFRPYPFRLFAIKKKN